MKEDQVKDMVEGGVAISIEHNRTSPFLLFTLLNFIGISSTGLKLDDLCNPTFGF